MKARGLLYFSGLAALFGACSASEPPAADETAAMIYESSGQFPGFLWSHEFRFRYYRQVSFDDEPQPCGAMHLLLGLQGQTLVLTSRNPLQLGEALFKLKRSFYVGKAPFALYVDADQNRPTPGEETLNKFELHMENHPCELLPDPKADKDGNAHLPGEEQVVSADATWTVASQSGLDLSTFRGAFFVCTDGAGDIRVAPSGLLGDVRDRKKQPFPSSAQVSVFNLSLAAFLTMKLGQKDTGPSAEQPTTDTNTGVEAGERDFLSFEESPQRTTEITVIFGGATRGTEVSAHFIFRTLSNTR